MDRVRVLVVDDSAYVRKVVKEMLSRSPAVDVVGTARDGDEALDMVGRLKPDVVTCDLIMPATDGIEFIRRQMAIQPVPVVVVSIAAESSERVLSALDAGAVDFVQKPTALATDKVLDIAEELIAKVKAAAGAPMTRLSHAAVVAAAPVSASFSNRYDLLAIGVSTGGPQGLKSVIPRLPADFPAAVAIVLHMPVGYTDAYAKRLSETSALTVIEAGTGFSFLALIIGYLPTISNAYSAREIDITRVQMLYFTLVTASFVVMRVVTTYVIPEIPQGFQILMGISNAVYFGSKVAQPAASAATAQDPPGHPAE